MDHCDILPAGKRWIEKWENVENKTKPRGYQYKRAITHPAVARRMERSTGMKDTNLESKECYGSFHDCKDCTSSISDVKK